jgi:hypothetical protein
LEGRRLRPAPFLVVFSTEGRAGSMSQAEDKMLEIMERHLPYMNPLGWFFCAAVRFVLLSLGTFFGR